MGFCCGLCGLSDNGCETTPESSGKNESGGFPPRYQSPDDGADFAPRLREFGHLIGLGPRLVTIVTLAGSFAARRL